MCMPTYTKAIETTSYSWNIHLYCYHYSRGDKLLLTALHSSDHSMLSFHKHNCNTVTTLSLHLPAICNIPLFSASAIIPKMINATTISPAVMPITVTAMLTWLSVETGLSPVSASLASETYYGKLLDPAMHGEQPNTKMYFHFISCLGIFIRDRVDGWAKDCECTVPKLQIHRAPTVITTAWGSATHAVLLMAVVRTIIWWVNILGLFFQ